MAKAASKRTFVTTAAPGGPAAGAGGRPKLWLMVAAVAAVAGAWAIRASVQARRQAAAERAVEEQRGLAQQRALEIDRLRAAEQLNPNDIAAHQALEAVYARYNMPDQFLQEAETVAHLAPRDEQAQLVLASTYGAMKKWPDAVARYLAIVRAWPSSADGWQGLAVTLYSLKHYERAMWASQRALKLQPNDPRNQFGYAASSLQWAIETNRTGSQIPVITQAAQTLSRLQPDWPDKAGIAYLLGRAYAALDRVDLAQKNLDEANRLQPQSPDIAYGLAELDLHQQKVAQGRAVLERALQANRSEPNLTELMGQLWEQSGAPGSQARALSAYRTAALIDPNNSRFQERLGSALLAANDLQGARRAFQNAILLDPNRAFPYQQLSVIYLRLGNKARARQIAKAATEVAFNADQLQHLESLAATHPESIPLHLELGNRYKELGQWNLAEDEYLSAQELSPTDKSVQQALESLAMQQRQGSDGSGRKAGN